MATELARSHTIECVGRDARTLSEINAQTDQHCRAKTVLLSIGPHGMICHTSSLIRQSRHFERDFDRVLLQLVDILNTV